MNKKYKSPWYKYVRRWGQTNLTEDDPRRNNLDFWREQWKRTDVQGLIINCSGIVAYYPSGNDLQYLADSLEGRDYFKEWSDAAREEGLAVIARMDINRAGERFYKAHPDWFCVDENGVPYQSQGMYFSCVNSKYYSEYIPDTLREVVDRYAPDGFADNSWQGMGRDKICYCENCRASFKKYSGLELPRCRNWDDPAYRAWIRWSYQTRMDNWDLFSRTVQKAGGEDCLWCGMVHGGPVGGRFCDLKIIAARSKILFTDHQSRDSVNGAEQNALSGSLLRMAADENIQATGSMANYVRGERMFRLSATSPQETRTWMISGMAGGMSPWYHHIGGSQNDSRQFDIPVPVMNWHKENEEYLYDRKDLAEVGLVWSQENADFYGRDNAQVRCLYPFRGFGLAMTKRRIPYIPVNAADIGRYSYRLKTLILPDVAILSPEQTGAVLTFAKNGGNLIVSGRTGSLDRDGLPLKENRLFDLLGLSIQEETFGDYGKGNFNIDNKDPHTYIRLPEERHPVLSNFEKTTLIPFGGSLTVVASAGPLSSVAGYIPAFPIYPPEFSWIRTERPDIGTVFAGKLPGGGKVVYFAADIDRYCGFIQLPDHINLLANAVEWTVGYRLPLKVEGRGLLDCKIYEKDEKIIVHVVNLSGANVLGYSDEIYPVGPVRVSVRSGRKLSSVSLRVSGRTLPVEYADGVASVSVEKIESHEMLVFE